YSPELVAKPSQRCGKLWILSLELLDQLEALLSEFRLERTLPLELLDRHPPLVGGGRLPPEFAFELLELREPLGGNRGLHCLRSIELLELGQAVLGGGGLELALVVDLLNGDTLPLRHLDNGSCRARRAFENFGDGELEDAIVEKDEVAPVPDRDAPVVPLHYGAV